MIDCDDLLSLESLIRWGIVDASKQRHFEERINGQLDLVKCSDKNGATLLILAAGAGNFEATHFLCTLGADANALSYLGETPLINVVREADTELKQSQNEILARLKIIDCLAEHGANPNLLGYQGCSALHWSVIYGQVKFVDRLLLMGARSEIRLNDPPDHQTANELVNSTRFRGTDTQKKLIAELLEFGLPSKTI